MSGSTSSDGAQATLGSGSGAEATESAGHAATRDPREAHRAELNRRNARSQVEEGDFARSRLHGEYPGPISAILASLFTTAKTRRDWAEGAVRAYSNAISLDRALPEAYVGRASVYRFLGRYADAKQDLERAKELGVTEVVQDELELAHRLRRRRLTLAATIATAIAICCGVAAYHPRTGERLTPAPLAAESRSSIAAAQVAPRIAVKPTAPPQPRVAPTPALSKSPGALNVVPPARQAAVKQRCIEQELAESAACPPAARPPAPDRVPRAVAAAPVEPAAPAPAASECPTCSPSQAQTQDFVPELPGVDPEDARMIASACRSSEAAGEEAHRACIAAQVESLEQAIPMPDLSSLPQVDRQLVRRACIGTAQEGPAAYRRCISSQLIGLAGAPDLPNLSALPAERRQAIELACGSVSGAAAYHNCVARQVKQSRVAQPSAGMKN